MQIRIRTNEQGLLHQQHHVFTNPYLPLVELLQNARRASATRIDVTHDEENRYLRVSDNGCGIGDFQDLLTLYQSGWSESVSTAELPAGIGFSTCLYASTRCTVRSRGRRIDLDTADILTGGSAEAQVIEPDDRRPTNWTVIELFGIALPCLGTQIDELCQGFPVPMVFNGTDVDRRNAVDRLLSMPSPIGQVHLADIESDMRPNPVLVFLQGRCVARPDWLHDGHMDVVHLDPRQFSARLPDRDRLVDEDLNRLRIQAARRSSWRTKLLAMKAVLPPDRFAQTYYPAMRTWDHLDLLNNPGLIPTQACHRITGYPVQGSEGLDSHLSPPSVVPTRAQVESGAVVLVDIDPVDEANAACWMLARAKGYLVVNRQGLDADHWAQRHLRRLDIEPVTVQAVQETHRTTLRGSWIAPVLVLCQAVRIRIGDDTADIADDGVFHRGCLYIPACESSGDPVLQVSSYVDELDQLLECDLEHDQQLLKETLHRLRASDPLALLDQVLRPLNLAELPLLHGRSFTLTLGQGVAPGYSLEEIIECEDPHHARP